jgi:antitoxin (DNA-binding transcriptional repressor) of toxin-antitoxin stability system
MREFSVREMRAGYGAIATALETDGEVVLTHHGKPFAKVVPLVAQPDPVAAEAERRRRREAWAEQRMKALARMPVLPPFDWDAFRADR